MCIVHFEVKILKILNFKLLLRSNIMLLLYFYYYYSTISTSRDREKYIVNILLLIEIALCKLRLLIIHYERASDDI